MLSKPKMNPREKWIVQPNCSPAMIPQERFAAVQRRLSNLTHRRSDEQLPRELRGFIHEHGPPNSAKARVGLHDGKIGYAVQVPHSCQRQTE